MIRNRRIDLLFTIARAYDGVVVTREKRGGMMIYRLEAGTPGGVDRETLEFARTGGVCTVEYRAWPARARRTFDEESLARAGSGLLNDLRQGLCTHAMPQNQRHQEPTITAVGFNLERTATREFLDAGYRILKSRTN